MLNTQFRKLRSISQVSHAVQMVRVPLIIRYAPIIVRRIALLKRQQRSRGVTARAVVRDACALGLALTWIRDDVAD